MVCSHESRKLKMKTAASIKAMKMKNYAASIFVYMTVQAAVVYLQNPKGMGVDL